MVAALRFPFSFRSPLSRRFRLFAVLFAVLLCFSEARAAGETAGDSLRISLLTCSPGEEVYEVFGHTAIRVQQPAGHLDVVFNYGIFSFRTPHFIWRFTKGETDYMLGVTGFSDFIMGYAMRNSAVYEQELYYTQADAEALLEALTENSLPQNRVYRYDFLFDNCSTRACDMLLAHLSGKVQFDSRMQPESFRQMIDGCTAAYPWLTFGIDLALGAPLDREAAFRESFFLPERLMNAFEKARLQRPDGTLVPLVVRHRVVLESDGVPVTPPPPFTNPMVIGSLVLALVVAASLYECWRGVSFRWLDALLFGVAGLVGLLLFFLMFVSTHPATYPNYLGFWLHPFQLFVVIAVWFRGRAMRRILCGYHVVDFLSVMGLLLFWNFIPQHFNWAFLPLMLVWAVRSATYLIQAFLRRTNS